MLDGATPTSVGCDDCTASSAASTASSFLVERQSTPTTGLPPATSFNRDFTPDDLRPELESCGVKGTVLVQVLHQVGGETEECLDHLPTR